MNCEQLTGKDNPLLKTLRKLTRQPAPINNNKGNKGNNDGDDRLALEGIRLLEEAEKAAGDALCTIEAVVIAAGFGREAREERLLRALRRRGARLCQIPERLFATLSAVEQPQGIMALVRAPRYELDEIALPAAPLVLCAVAIQDPGNLGTLLRTAAAAGAALALTSRGTVAARNPKVLRSSAGAFFHIPIIEQLTTGAVLTWCERQGIRLYRTDARAGVSHTRADLTIPCGVVLGNEGGGLDAAEFAALPAIHIPMARHTESLNVAAAGAILLFEAARQRAALTVGANNF